MNGNEKEQQIINNYQNDEKMMILIYAQWCINHELDPISLYMEAYPYQENNNALAEAIELTVTKAESDEISSDMLMNVLQLFGNNDLAFIVQREIEKIEKQEPRNR
ncbi:hypothetical protein [Virgibacillus halodenitrificans]|uniref:Uncharacterized protein n=1 Tax=Virgibacillus halodenitrificans TaxID=1482 RepID=A0AAC9NJR9_VIRHA|nr:hypothetical protein [Virgibacillus halodenitrificans]APC47065.1 hypothetical protein BME96_02135 [Virgibacillus halodenitrificans]WHX25205.1 hypothetical protein QNH47_13700 [Virgibacillus halodenitrificans]CDQ37441.1 hypothetical protein BN993_06992 [Virgibacillus halodenitrificans]